VNRLAVSILVSLILLAQAGLVEASPASTGGEVVRATLSNGMRVILLPNKLAPVATTIVSYGVGSDDDSMPGIAHATEHMMFRGTSGVSAGQFADIAARMGAQYNAFTLNENTVYYFKLPSAYVNVALQLEADRMTHALIRAKDWATERGAIEQEISGQQSQPGYRIGVKLRESFFKGTPFANTTGGTIPSFEKMQSQDILAFYHSWYHPANATLIIAGDINAQETLVRVHSLFDPIAAGTLPERKPITVPPLAASTIQDSMDFPVGFGALAYRLPGSNDADYAASQVMSEVFKSGRGALADLTANGQVLAVVSFASAFPELGATFLVVIPAQGATPQSAQSLVTSVLDQYRKDGMPPDLIDAAKTRLLSERAYGQSSISGLSLAWAQAIVQRRSGPDQIYSELEKVSYDDVNRVLRSYVTADHQVAVIILPKPSSTMPRLDPNAGVENVAYTPTVHEPLPTWASIALKAPLSPPQEDTTTVNQSLPNGVRLTIRHESTSPTVVLSAVIRSSPDLYEPKGKDGVNLLVDGLLPWGTTTYDRKAYQAQLDSIAAAVTLGTTFSLRVQSKDFEHGVQLLADAMLHPAFPQSGFAVVKADVLQSVAVANRLPKEQADLAERRALYPAGDPRRRDITEKTISAITLDDVKSWYRFAYRPDETTVAIVGDITPVQAHDIMLKYFGAWKSNGRQPTFHYPALPDKPTKALSVTVKAPTNTQSQVTLKQVIRLRRSDDDYVPMLLANTMLSGEGTGSLLFQNLRTHYGYVYSVDSAIDVSQDRAEFTISFASEPVNVSRAEAAAVAIIKRLQTHPLAGVELQRAKALLLAQRVLPLDSYEGVASDMLGGAKDGYYNEGKDKWFWDALVQTTPAQIEHAMRRINADRFVRVVVAP